MVDRWANKIVQPTMEDVAEYLPRQISADTITLVGFVIGMAAVPLLWLKLYSDEGALLHLTGNTINSKYF